MILKNIVKSIYYNAFRHGFGTLMWKKRFGCFGENSTIGYPAVITDESKIYIGKGTTILPNSRIQNYSNKTEGIDGIYIGDYCYLGFGLSLLNASKIRIGNSVLMASNVLISSENHGMDPESTIPYMDQDLTARDVLIEDGVWIGQNVCILPGVTIGEKAIVGAGSVVTKSIPAYCIAVGNPAKVIKRYDFEKHLWESINKDGKQ